MAKRVGKAVKKAARAAVGRRFRLCWLLTVKLPKSSEILYVRDDDYDVAKDAGAEHIPLVDENGEPRTTPPFAMYASDLPKAELKWKRININIVEVPDSREPDTDSNGGLTPATAGFSLVELMVVIAGIAILATMAVPGYLSAMKTRRAAACSGNLQLYQVAKQAYWTDFHAVPPSDPADANGIRKYMPGGTLPGCPSGGAYLNLTDLTTPCACSLSNSPENPDWNRRSEPSANINKNGYHNLGY